MSQYAVDWSATPENMWIREILPNGKSPRVQWSGDFFSWIKSLKRGDVVLAEVSFEPYKRQIHNEIVTYCQENGIELLVINQRETANERINRGIQATDDEDGLNKEDSLILADFLREGKKHLYKPSLWEIHDETWQDRANSERRIGWPSKKTWLAMLPPKPPEEHKDALLNGSAYADGFVLPLIVAAMETTNEGGTRDDYERYVGSSGAGYPSYLRATFYRRVRTLDLRDLGVRSFRKSGINVVNDHPDVHKKNMKKVRKASRWIFYQVRNKIRGT